MSSSKDFISLPNQRTQSQSQTQAIDISWTDLSVSIKNQSYRQQGKVEDVNEPLLLSQRVILDNLSGHAKAGEMTAIMGPSGAGKTTLLACLSNRFKPPKGGAVSGNVLANNTQYTKYTDFGGFVMQDDLLMASLTVRESLMFVAKLRIKGTKIDQLQKVDQVIRDLNLRDCQNTYIGDKMIKGISGGEKKRTCIGVELISDPPVLMLDEPTSGLDSYTAFICMNILKKIAKNQKRTIIFTIHQPSTDIYNLFDRLIILNQGQTMYQGQAQHLVAYCKQINLHVDKYQNPLDAIMNNMNTHLNSKEPVVTHENYQIYMAADNNSYQSPQNGFLKRRTQNSFATEILVLANRQLINYIRSPNLLKAKILGAVFMSLFLGYLFWGVGGEAPPEAPEVSTFNQVVPYLQNMSGALFVCGTSAIFSALGPLLALFPVERTIFLKEENSKLYNIWTYFLSKVLLETPMNILIQLCLSLFLYYAFSFNWEFWSVLEFLIISVTTSLCGNGIGIFTGCLFQDAKKSASLGPVILLPLQLFGGQSVVLDSIPKWIGWIQYISPFKYFLEGFGRSQLEDVQFKVISQNGYQIINPMEYYGRTFGLWNCIWVLIGISIGFHILALIALKLLVQKINV